MFALFRVGLIAASVAATSVHAASSINVLVTATIAGRCEFLSSAAINIDFGRLNEVSGEQIKTANTQFWCTQGLAYTLSRGLGQNANAGQANLKSDSNQLLPYSLSVSPTGGNGSGQSTPISATLTATISDASLSAAAIGDNYRDTVVLTLNP